MKIDELLNPLVPQPLLEGLTLSIYEDLIQDLMLEDDAAAPPADSSPPAATGGTLGTTATTPVVDGSGSHNCGPYEIEHWGGGPIGVGPVFGGAWFNQLYASVKQLITAKRIKTRMKQIGISTKGAARVEKAAKNAAKNVKDLLSNPRRVAYQTPVWTTQKMPKPMLKKWNEHFGEEFQKELAKLTVDDLFEGVNANDLATQWLGVKTLGDAQPALRSEEEQFLDRGRQAKRQVIDTPMGKTVVILYTLGDKKMVRLETADRKMKSYVA